MNRFPLSELEEFKANVQGKGEEELAEELLDLLILSYLDGVDAANEMLSSSVKAELSKMREVIEKETGGKTFRDRIRTHVSEGTSLNTLAEAESIRVYNQAVLDSAEKAGAKEKTWNSIGDERTRDSHTALDGITIPLDAYFYTGKSKTLAPGGFDEAGENCGCRCFLTVH